MYTRDAFIYNSAYHSAIQLEITFRFWMEQSNFVIFAATALIWVAGTCLRYLTGFSSSILEEWLFNNVCVELLV